MKLHHYRYYLLMLCGICHFSTTMTTCIQLSFFILQPNNVENSSDISLQHRMCYEWAVYFLSSFGLFKQLFSCRDVRQGRSTLRMQIRKPCNSYFKSPALFTNLLTDRTYIRVRHQDILLPPLVNLFSPKVEVRNNLLCLPQKKPTVGQLSTFTEYEQTYLNGFDNK